MNARARAAMARVQGLTAILMKRRNGQEWTEADRAQLRHGLRQAARWAPALALFLLPGSLLLLPLLAWALDRRRVRRTGDNAVHRAG